MLGLEVSSHRSKVGLWCATYEAHDSRLRVRSPRLARLPTHRVPVGIDLGLAIEAASQGMEQGKGDRVQMNHGSRRRREDVLSGDGYTGAWPWWVRLSSHVPVGTQQQTRAAAGDAEVPVDAACRVAPHRATDVTSSGPPIVADRTLRANVSRLV